MKTHQSQERRVLTLINLETEYRGSRRKSKVFVKNSKILVER